MSACSTQTAVPAPRSPVKVNGANISRAMISQETQNHPAENPIGAWKKAALALVIREALAQEVRRLGFTAVPISDGEGRTETQDEANIRGLIEHEIVVPEPSEQECARYYERNAARFRAPAVVEAAHILISADRENTEAYQAALLQARVIIKELQRDRALFPDLARIYSACASGKEGGHLGQLTPGDTTPEFEAALAGMSPHSISVEPVETRYGVHVIHLERREEGRVLPFERVREHIAEYLTEAVRRRAQAQYTARLLATCRIEGIEVGSPGDVNVY